MIVIADTSPISYLILIDEIDILPQLYGRILIPTGVFAELTAVNAPEKVRGWFKKKPEWLEIWDLPLGADSYLLDILDRGESEAIQLAKNLKADLIVIDELAPRQIAIESGLRVIGLIGVLASASEKGLIATDEVISKLERTNFYVSNDLIEFLRRSKN